MEVACAEKRLSETQEKENGKGWGKGKAEGRDAEDTGWYA
jgi:hypothetical protein